MAIRLTMKARANTRGTPVNGAAAVAFPVRLREARA
jgi:hypothetical protein